MPIRFSCPKCEKPVTTKEENAGKKAKCPQCGEPLAIPEATPENTAPAAAPPAPKARKTIHGPGFNVIGHNVEIIGEPDPGDQKFSLAFTQAVEHIGQEGAAIMQLDFSKSEYRNQNRLPIISLAKNVLRPHDTQLQISLTGFWA